MKKKSVQNRSFVKLSKRPTLLLELMIAFTLVVLCAFPLLYPHFYMVKAEKEAVRIIELDRLVGFIYADLVGKLYRNEVTWEKLSTPINYEIRDLELNQHLSDQLKDTYYTGHYSFEQIEMKKPEVEGNNLDGYISHHHMKVIFNFHPVGKPHATPITFERSFYVKRNVKIDVGNHHEEAKT